MVSLNCFNCNTPNNEIDNFCSSCGSRVKCKSCKTIIKKGANFCTICGESLDIKKTSETTLNTIKYRKNAADVSYEISFTNEIGKEGMNDLLTAIVNNRSGFQQPLTEKEKSYNGEALQNISYSKIEESQTHDVTLTVQDSIEIPHINDLETKIDCSENIWIALHAFYLSSYGRKNFTKKEVKVAYMARRKTDNRVSHYSREWKIAHKNFFKTINDNELSFQTGKIESIRAIILGTDNKIKANVSKNKSTPNSTSPKKAFAKSIKIEEFNLSKSTGKVSLEEFIALKNPGESTSDRIVVIAYYITRIQKVDFFTEGQIEFAYKALQLNNRPGHLRQTINNIKNTKVWFKDVSQGQWSLERMGEIYVEDKLPANS